MSNILYTPFSTFDGLRIVESKLMIDVIEDWSSVRSPSRAIRRRRNGHRQNIKFVKTPKKIGLVGGGVLMIHPQMAAELRKIIALRAEL